MFTTVPKDPILSIDWQILLQFRIENKFFHILIYFFTCLQLRLVSPKVRMRKFRSQAEDLFLKLVCTYVDQRFETVLAAIDVMTNVKAFNTLLSVKRQGVVNLF